MSLRSLLIAMTSLAACLGRPEQAAAHELDEYLQATRLLVERDRVNLEIDLTAGVAVVPQILARVDTDDDGAMSSAEWEAYAQVILSSIALAVDGQRVSAALTDRRFPDLQEMAQGQGPIRLRATATFPAAAAGRHQIYYRNTHESDIGVYLVNTMVPDDKQIEITAQRRDYAQHEITVEYQLISDSRGDSLWWLIAGLAMAGILSVTRRSSIGAKWRTSHPIESPN